MTRLLFLLLPIFLSINLSAQVETSIHAYKIPATSFSLTTTEALAYGEDYILVANVNSEVYFSSLIRTNEEGEEIDRIDKLEVEGLQVINTIYLGRHEAGILGLANAYNETEDKYFFLSFLVTPDFSTINLLDTLELEYDRTLYFSRFRESELFDGLEGFGSERESTSNAISANVYLNLNQDGMFQRYEVLNLFSWAAIISDFIFHPLHQQYFLTFFERTSVVINSDFELLDYLDNAYTSFYDDITYHNRFNQYNCHFQEHLECVGLGIPNSVYRVSIMDWLWEENFIEIDDVQPITPVAAEANAVATSSVIDTGGNLIVVVMGLVNLWNSSVETNTLHIMKYDTTRNLMWQHTFNDGNEYVPHGIALDQNNNLLIFGMLSSENPSFQVQAFLLKITESEEPTNVDIIERTNTLRLSPNPSGRFLNIKLGQAFKSGEYFIYNNLGVLVKQVPIFHTTEQLDLLDLPSGAYSLVCILNDKSVITQKFIKL